MAVGKDPLQGRPVLAKQGGGQGPGDVHARLLSHQRKADHHALHGHRGRLRRDPLRRQGLRHLLPHRTTGAQKRPEPQGPSRRHLCRRWQEGRGEIRSPHT